MLISGIYDKICNLYGREKELGINLSSNEHEAHVIFEHGSLIFCESSDHCQMSTNLQYHPDLIKALELSVFSRYGLIWIKNDRGRVFLLGGHVVGKQIESIDNFGKLVEERVTKYIENAKDGYTYDSLCNKCLRAGPHLLEHIERLEFNDVLHEIMFQGADLTKDKVRTNLYFMYWRSTGLQDYLALPKDTIMRLKEEIPWTTEVEEI